MPPLDVQLTLHNQIWSLLEASAAFTTLVTAGNRLKATALDMTAADRAKHGPGDYPKVRVEVGEETVGNRAPRTFGHSRTDFSSSLCDYGVPETVSLTVKIVHDKTRLGDQTPLEAAVRGALLNKGTNLGIAWVSSSVLRGVNRREENTPDTGGSLRTVSRFRLVVNAIPKLSQLTAT